MSPTEKHSKLSDIVKANEATIAEEWLNDLRAIGQNSKLIKLNELKEQVEKFMSALRDATRTGQIDSIAGANWDEMKNFLSTISASRATQGFTTSETASFIFSFRKPLFKRVSEAYGKDTAGLADEVIRTGELIDKLGLYTTESFLKTRDKIISRQQEEMLELSTPVVKLWDGILALPMIGTLDSARTQVVMETLLQKIVETGSELAIIDITGVPTVDTLVAQHLLKTVSAARLMGADCIISGIRPQIAQTMVHLGVDLSQVITKASLADAFVVALQKLGKNVQTGQLANRGVAGSNQGMQKAPVHGAPNSAKDRSWNGYQ